MQQGTACDRAHLCYIVKRSKIILLIIWISLNHIKHFHWSKGLFSLMLHISLIPSVLLCSFQPHTLFSLMSVHLAQGNMTGALALFRHILTTALSTSSSFSSLTGCEQCRSSLPLLRCLQFYPFLYNLSQRQPCSGKPIKAPRLIWISNINLWDCLKVFVKSRAQTLFPVFLAIVGIYELCLCHLLKVLAYFL